MRRLDKEGRIFYTKNGMPRLKRYLDEAKGQPLSDVWQDIFPVVSWSKERVGYDTQKPEELLRRILSASSNSNDLVLDCFCGSGTTPVVAEKLGRRWIAATLAGLPSTRLANACCLSLRSGHSSVQNLGKYERQLWQAAEFGESATARTAAYRTFILDLYRATPINGLRLAPRPQARPDGPRRHRRCTGHGGRHQADRCRVPQGSRYRQGRS